MIPGKLGAIGSAFTIALLIGALVAAAEEPTGFDEFPWGTSLADINDQLLGPRCGGLQAVRGDRRSLCQSYDLDGIGPAMLGLSFKDNTLQGYVLIVPDLKAEDFLRALEARFGQPTGSIDQVILWTWSSGTRAVFRQRSPLGAMLQVDSKTLMDQFNADFKALLDP